MQVNNLFCCLESLFLFTFGAWCLNYLQLSTFVQGVFFIKKVSSFFWQKNSMGEKKYPTGSNYYFDWYCVLIQWERLDIPFLCKFTMLYSTKTRILATWMISINSLSTVSIMVLFNLQAFSYSILLPSKIKHWQFFSYF